ncbi:gastrula zinc finger protein XlCGF52.1 [Uranotaenia lowii]|uniref:gastrula zinc finger protein XlCGF52.1 n=1 Tax=Uranotaenia lowii TaxID=190385 RepID=UPI0024795BD2|nr:gastrula zinc finger protein XlCGF52.1 [Uranotaenia lowii]
MTDLKECTICCKPLRTRSSRNYHEHCANPERKPFKCDRCERTFSSKYHKTFHEEVHMARRLSCSYCDKSYQHQRDLDLHQREHEHSPGFGCNRCSEKFDTTEALAKHKKCHEPKERFKCSQCELTFSLKGNLTKHVRILHSKSEKFKCDQCPKEFSRKNALQFHLLSHMSRNFQCRLCEKGFFDMRNLERHMKTHITAKEFSCSTCGITSSRKDNIMRHVRSFHPGIDHQNAVLKNEIRDQLGRIKQDAEKSNKNKQSKECSDSASAFSNRISVIRTVGTPKPVEKIKKIDAPQQLRLNSKPSTKPVVDPLEIYRKILRPSNDDDDEEDNENHKTTTVSRNQSESSQSHPTDDHNDQHPSYATSTMSSTVDSRNTDRLHPVVSNISSINNFSEVHWRKQKSQFFTNSTR